MPNSQTFYTIYILWLRQIKRYLRSRSRMIGSLGQPILFLVALGYGLGPTFAAAGGGNYIQFLAPGVIAMGILFTAVFTGIEIIWDRQFGFLKETLVAPVSRTSIMVGRTLGGATVAMLQGIVVLIISLFIGFHPAFSSIPLALLFMAGIAIIFTALGTGIASVLEDMQGFQLIMYFVVMPTFFLSGAIFPLSGVIGIVARFNPLTYGVDGLRAALTGVSQIGLATDAVAVVAVAVLLVAIGAWLFERIQV